MPHVAYVGPEPESSWRRMAGAAWGGPSDPTIYGLIDVDARPMLARIDALRAAGARVTPTHVVARAVAVALARHPELNVVFRRRRAYRRAGIDVFIHAALPAAGGLGKAELTGLKVRDADRLGLLELAAEVDRRLERIRKDDDAEISRSRRSIATAPRFLLRPMLRLIHWLGMEWNVDLHTASRAIPGSAAVTNVGTLGVDTGFAPLFPIGGPPILVTVGAAAPGPSSTSRARSGPADPEARRDVRSPARRRPAPRHRVARGRRDPGAGDRVDSGVRPETVTCQGVVAPLRQRPPARRESRERPVIRHAGAGSPGEVRVAVHERPAERAAAGRHRAPPRGSPTRGASRAGRRRRRTRRRSRG
ncbi:MAG: 2-oxo acid dehydrogenase subunit E2 [Acidobacteriota bacterium]